MDPSENDHTDKGEIFGAEARAWRKCLAVVKRLERAVKLLKDKENQGETILCETLKIAYGI